MTFGSLFTGIGGFDLGLEQAGMRCVWQVEMDTHCNKVLAKHWPDVLRHDDVRTFRATQLVRPDWICGGFPCQDISVAGLRAGLAGERSGLWWEFHRIIAEYRPGGVLIENVPGLLSSNGGRDMAAIVGALGQLGYGWAYRVLDARWFGVPQRRRRVFIVGCLGDVRRAGQILFESNSLPWDSPPSGQAGARVAYAVAAGAGGSKFGSGRAGQDDFVTANCVDAHMGMGGPDDNAAQANHLIAATVTAGVSNGKGVNPPGRRREDDFNIVTHTLRAEGHDASEDGTGRGVPLVPIAFQTRIARNGRGQPSDQVSALTSSDAGMHADSKPHVTTRSGVRRLLPVEVERLQGFPDDHTRYAADDSELSDSARYRMCGNAVAVPCARWIGQRIIEPPQ